MEFSNKTILIIGLVIGGLVSLYLHQSELAYTIFGGLIGYLSKDTLTVKHEQEIIDVPLDEDINE